ncbi:hypothetical protein Trydic_g23167 [Trypoxylus dichotomus]
MFESNKSRLQRSIAINLDSIEVQKPTVLDTNTYHNSSLIQSNTNNVIPILKDAGNSIAGTASPQRAAAAASLAVDMVSKADMYSVVVSTVDIDT